MNLVLKVKLPNDRKKTGTLTLVDPATGLPLAGPYPVLGRAARNQAANMGNPSADPKMPFGDTPLGSYTVPNIVANGDGTSRPSDQYGQSGSIVLNPVAGEALIAKNNGRTGLLIHAGRNALSSVIPPTMLKPTNGCIRMLDWDLKLLIKAIRDNALIFPGSLTVEVTEDPGVQGDIDESINDLDPPPTGGITILP